MSQDKSKDGGGGDGRASPGPKSQPPKPKYMTVGTGSTSASAHALMASLDRDSGYGGSIAGDSFTNDGSTRNWNPVRTPDIPTPLHSLHNGGEGGGGSSEQDRRTLASHVHQLHYNQNRVALGRSINRTVDILRDLQRMNSAWPAHYPSTHRQDPSRQDPRPGITRTATDELQRPPSSPRPGINRAATTLGEGAADEAESSAAAQQRPQAPEPLITPEAVHDFSILKLDLKLQGLSQMEIAHSMDRKAIASLLEGRINKSIRHLLLLRDRIEDTTSKVLVTGDLNAGKSTFCNALLRRKVLPEDQQPCTSIFCEVLDARENGGVEEAHAVHKDAVYSRNDESTYDVYPLDQLENIVIDSERYTQCKVYVKDSRTIDESLLNNGVVDIALIDAPGLNSDSLKTTAVFARQEEIDVVVFVVSAANHFTLSAQEFIWNAAHEKAYIFIVVNGYDNIRDKNRCQKTILEQVAKMSPRTFKESSELVHFVSSNAIPIGPALPGGGPGGDSGGSGSGSGSGPSGDPDDDDDKGKGKGKEKERKENQQDFDHLEASLRRFVLEKRARSKLYPAKTYLLNILNDLNSLSTLNRDVAQSELDRVVDELAEIEPAFERSQKASTEVDDSIESSISTTCDDIYEQTRDTLNRSIARVADEDLGVEYPGLLGAFQFAEDIKVAIMEQIADAVAQSEDRARKRAEDGVAVIRALGIKHLGNEYVELKFRSDIMFKRKRDALARQIDTPVEVWDFVDVGSMWERQEKVAGTGMAMTVVGVLGGRLVGGVGWFDGVMGAVRVMGMNNVRRMIVPGIIATVCLGTAYMLHSIPYSLPHRLARRIAATLDEQDYTHRNSYRISDEVRTVLRFPAKQLSVGLQHSVESLSKRRDEQKKAKRESEVARKYFANLVRDSDEGRRAVESVDLDGVVPGVAGGYEAGSML